MKRANDTVCLFDRFSLTIPSALKCHQDSSDGKRVLFLTNSKESFIISFEEGMQMLDMLPTQSNTVCFQCCKDGKYIHLRRSANGIHAFFHLELEDAEGKPVYLPGQMTTQADYRCSDEVEPVLMQLMDGLSIVAKERQL